MAKCKTKISSVPGKKNSLQHSIFYIIHWYDDADDEKEIFDSAPLQKFDITYKRYTLLL